MIGIGIPKWLSTLWIRGKILAFAMCLQFKSDAFKVPETAFETR
jgi:hypothetical protein